MTKHYVFTTEFCNPAADWEKGQVEKNVQDAPTPLVATDAGLSRFGGVECLAGTALPGPVAVPAIHAGPRTGYANTGSIDHELAYHGLAKSFPPLL
ncbi:hypothetical protein QFZ34_001497 [Phyllobacterium ifriqiyense]|uniref:Uncharacterized protein n=1 Tax=Phyllobacterium ifriqiyense TaxID=314238 RepID=A0ABU0S6D8_9HYPH|nr:hypothetical protein [Phyllobacterium ifriqiyense]